ncbi:glycosyltransferase [Shouchella lehensis]|uniref:Glycosyltransferase n=1 Tax=Shouchella lehensis G1 TaxID=1246626 RepID=A0A060M6I1_9BACI|nr:glycosyltransferase [Shouchella lehensis]AIC96163.1 glycosyltransferase [Shouchella lehensis G1]
MFENKVFLVTYGIGPESGGVTVATLNQSKMFADANYDVSIITFEYNREYKQIFADLKAMNRIYDDADHLNKYEYYAKKNTLSFEKDEALYLKEHPFYEEGYQTLLHDEESFVQIFDNGGLVKQKYYDADQKLIAVEYFNELKVLLKRVDFSDEKYPLRIQLYNDSTGFLSRESYYTADGFCYLTRYYNEKGDSGEVYLFDRATNQVTKFTGNKQHDSHWLNELAVEQKIGKKLPLFISNGQGSGSKVLGIDKKKGKKAFFVHNNHLHKPFTYGSEVKKKYDYVFSRINKFDAIIVLTEKQKQDIQAQYGEHQNIFVIPNAITITKHEPVEKLQNTVIMVTRLEKQKHLQRAIKLFPLVVKKIPNAQLNIFGKGSQKEQLEKCIKDNKMENHVFLRGYSRNIKQEIKKSNVSLLTSNYEGLPLAAVESLENGTPVVSYDFNYGATDIVDSGETGYVEPVDDKKALANRLIYLLQNPEIAEAMGELGRERMIERYSSEVVYQKWMDMLKKLNVSSKKWFFQRK